MTTLVETSEEEPTLAVARAIAEIAWSQGGADVSPLSLRRQLWFIERGYGLWERDRQRTQQERVELMTLRFMCR